jgi:hypothetical protein
MNIWICKYEDILIYGYICIYLYGHVYCIRNVYVQILCTFQHVYIGVLTSISEELKDSPFHYQLPDLASCLHSKVYMYVYIYVYNYIYMYVYMYICMYKFAINCPTLPPACTPRYQPPNTCLSLFARECTQYKI